MYALCLYLKSDVTFYGISENEVKCNTQKEYTETVLYQHGLEVWVVEGRIMYMHLLKTFKVECCEF